MDLQYIVRPHRNDDGKRCELHFLVDLTSSRSYGYVETPYPDEIMFVASLYEGKTRWYLSLEAAKGYLESAILKAETEECNEFAKSMGEKTPEPAAKEE